MPNSTHNIFSETIDCEKIAASARGQFHYFDSLDSTNSWLQNNGQCGDVCISNEQTAGRGRRGNRWVSPATGNIYFSLMWCFDSPLQQIEHISLLGLSVGIAVAEALADIGLHTHGVKWPNDIYWQQKKMGGILIENINPSNTVIIGIGLNVNMPKDEANKVDQYITSLSEALAKKNLPKGMTRTQLIISMIKHLNAHLTDFPTLAFEDFKQDWDKWDILKNKAVSFQHQNSQISATVVGLNKQGQLGLINADKQLQFYSSADIRLSKPL
jgi:BirA family biotin operon repressor/biotin-[acetyl-CoA-carboxylase] ligase